MKKILYVTANPKHTKESFGLQVGEKYIEERVKVVEDAEVYTLNLFKEEIPEIDDRVLSAWGAIANAGGDMTAANLTEEQTHLVTRLNHLLTQFIEADEVVFVTPMWNLSFPPRVKAYIDSLMVAGKTFAYTAEGPVGLLKGKTVVHVHASGGVYSEAPVHFANDYLKGIMNFMGVNNYHALFVEGMAAAPERADAILADAIVKAKDLAEKVDQYQTN